MAFNKVLYDFAIGGALASSCRGVWRESARFWWERVIFGVGDKEGRKAGGLKHPPLLGMYLSQHFVCTMLRDS